MIPFVELIYIESDWGDNMNLKNKIINYFVAMPIKSGAMPRVFRAPVTMSSDVAYKLINRQMKRTHAEGISGSLLHVCFDADSNILYIPNASSFSAENMKPLLQAAQIRITKDFGGYASRPPIDGSPFSSLRVRSLSSFPYAKKVISDHYDGKVFKNIPVLEANLARMPQTHKMLPKIFMQKGFMGGYVSPSFAQSISFIDEIDNSGKKRSKPLQLLTQSAPFILINTSPGTGREKEVPSATEKEGVVLNGYRDYLYDVQSSEQEKYLAADVSEFADLYAIKRQLYLGWSLEEVSLIFSGTVNSFPSLINFIDRLMAASNSLVVEGYKNPAEHPYYLTFKINPDKFPIKLSSLMDMQTGRMDPHKQLKNFNILEYDMDTGYILIETPIYVPPELCTKILGAIGNPFIGKYNPVMNTIDSKGHEQSYRTLKQEKRQLAKIKALVSRSVPEEKQDKLEYRTGPEARGQWATDPNIFNIRHVSDYLYAMDTIKKMCEELNEPFRDFDVIIGPIERFMGRGSQGGFIDEDGFKKQDLEIPYQLQKGLWMTPPSILINSVTMPSYADQTETLIHEYRHYIFGRQNPGYEKGYGDLNSKKGKAYYEEWDKYLSDPNERSAHLSEIKYALALGKSIDEIIRDKVGGKITMDNYPIAIKMADLVREAVQQLEQEGEMNENPVGTNE